MSKPFPRLTFLSGVTLDSIFVRQSTLNCEVTQSSSGRFPFLWFSTNKFSIRFKMPKGFSWKVGEEHFSPDQMLSSFSSFTGLFFESVPMLARYVYLKLSSACKAWCLFQLCRSKPRKFVVMSITVSTRCCSQRSRLCFKC